MFHFMIKPAQQQLAAEQARVAAAQPGANQMAEAQALQYKAESIKKRDATKNNYMAFMKQRMPTLSFVRREVGMVALWQEQLHTLGPLLTKFVMSDKTVKVDPVNFVIPDPPYTPNDPALEQEHFEFNLGTVSATGDYQSLMNHVRRWRKAPRLARVDNVSLQGNTPDLRVSYSLTVYIYPITPATTESRIAMAGTGTATGGAPGMPGGAPGMAGPPGIRPGVGPAGAAGPPGPPGPGMGPMAGPGGMAAPMPGPGGMAGPMPGPGGMTGPMPGPPGMGGPMPGPPGMGGPPAPGPAAPPAGGGGGGGDDEGMGGGLGKGRDIGGE